MVARTFGTIYELIAPSLRAGWRLCGLGIVSLLVLDTLDVILPILMMRGIDALARGESPLWWAGVYLGVCCVQAGLRVVWRLSLKTVETRTALRERRRLIAELLNQPLVQVQRLKRGNALALATTDVDAFSRMFESGIVVGIDALVYLIGIPIAMCFIDSTAALVVLAPLVVVPFVVRMGNAAVHRNYSLMQEWFSRLAVQVQELVGGLRAIKISAREPAMLAEIAATADQHASAAVKVNFLEAKLAAIVGAISALSLITLVGYGGYGVMVGTMSIGALIAFERYLRILSWPLQGVVFAGAIFEKGLTSGARLRTFLNTEHPEAVCPATDGKGTEWGLIVAPGTSREHEFAVPPGTWVGLVGPVGSGKSTALHALIAEDPAASGAVLAWSMPQEALGAVALVEQYVFILNDTIRNNIVFGRRCIGDEELWLAIAGAQLTEFVRGLPAGLDTVIGERGVTLSGGQRQRLALARALFGAVETMLLDDSTSNLDLETEAAIVKALRAEGRTRIIWATQRIEPLKQVDIVIVLAAGGKIVEVGWRAALLNDPHSALSQLFRRAELTEAIGRYDRAE